MSLMKGKKGLIIGVANERSIAWGISQKLVEAGAELAFTYLGDALKKRVVPLAEKLNSKVTFSCDVEKKEDVKKLYEHMVANRPTTGDKNSWEMASCTDGSAAGTTASNVLAEKINKWDKRFSTRRIKCDTSNPGKKSLKVFDICSAVTCEYVNSDIHDKLYFGKMKVTIKSSGTDSMGNPRKKTKFLYFQIY